MITLFAALSLAATPAPGLTLGPIQPPDPLRPQNTLNLFSPLKPSSVKSCSDSYTLAVAGSSPAGLRKLGDLPDANLEITVNRLVNGCPRPLIVSYKVSR